MYIFKMAFRDYGDKIAIFTGLSLVLVCFSSSSPLTWIVSTLMISPFLMSILKEDEIDIRTCLSRIISFKSVSYALLLLLSAFLPAIIIGLISLATGQNNWMLFLTVIVYGLIYSKMSPALFMVATGRRGIELRNKDMLLVLIILATSAGLNILLTKIDEINNLFALITTPVICYLSVLEFVFITLIVLKRNKGR